jgi:hypothetical protein
VTDGAGPKQPEDLQQLYIELFKAIHCAAEALKIDPPG